MIGRILATALVCAGAASSQTATAPSPASIPAAASSASAAKPKPYAFEVVSIRQNTSDSPGKMGGPTADGYLYHQPLLLMLMTAYVPQVGGAAVYSVQDQVKGLPDWVMTDRYDVDARIAGQDRAEWQQPESRKVMLRTMLQTLLADRCKLAVHREMKETRSTTLVVAKGGPKFKQTDPTVEHPDGQPLPFGGVVVSNKDAIHFYGTSMASLSSFLSSLANRGHPVQDKTGLTGLYDFTFSASPADFSDPETPPLEATFLSGLNNLGLKLDTEKGQVETLVVDHIERPTEN